MFLCHRRLLLITLIPEIPNCNCPSTSAAVSSRKMDPVSALGLASSVMQCIQFTSSLLKGTYNIYKSPQGLSAESLELDHVYGQLSDFSSDLAKQTATSSQPGTSPSKYEAGLKELAISCQEACDELLSVVKKLKSKNGIHRLRTSIILALKETMKQDDLSRLQTRINQIETSMVLHICAITR